MQIRSTRSQKINTQSEAQFINQKLNAAARKARLAQALLGTIWLKSASPQVWCPAAAVRAAPALLMCPDRLSLFPEAGHLPGFAFLPSLKMGEHPQLQAVLDCECVQQFRAELCLIINWMSNALVTCEVNCETRSARLTATCHSTKIKQVLNFTCSEAQMSSFLHVPKL